MYNIILQFYFKYTAVYNIILQFYFKYTAVYNIILQFSTLSLKNKNYFLFVK